MLTYPEIPDQVESGSLERELMSPFPSADDPEVQADLKRARALMPGLDYHEILGRIHAYLKPANYIEIGVEHGDTLRLAGADTLVLGVDPQPQLAAEAGPQVRIFPQTSDLFFAQQDVGLLLEGRSLDLALIDGLHLFEQVLKDFINLETYADEKTLIVIHDCLPLDERTASRQRSTRFWSGDVWKIVPCLRCERPDLQLITVPAFPTGLCLVRGLNPRSTLLHDNYGRLVKDYGQLDYNTVADREQTFSLITNDWFKIRDFLSV